MDAIYQPGETLPNGAVVIAERARVVLAVLPGNRTTPYASWFINADGMTVLGHYSGNLEEAAVDWTARVLRERALAAQIAGAV